MVTPKTNNSYDSDNRISGFNYYNDNSVNLDSYSFAYDDSNNIIEKVVNGRVNTYSWDELNQLIRADNQGEFEIDPTMLDVTQKLGTVQEDYVGQKPLDFNVDETELKLDYNSISIGFDIGMDTKLNRLVINPESISDRLREDKFAVYISDDNQSWQIMSRDLWSFNPDDLSVEISFKEPVSSRYIKLHCFYDDRSEMGVATDLSQIRNSRDSLLTAFITVDRMIEEFSYDSAGNREEYNVNYTNNRGYVSSYSYYDYSNLIKSDNKFGYIWDNNGNLVEKSDSYTVTNNDVTLNPDSGNYTKYSYDLLNRLTKVELSTSGSNNVTKEINYTYDHRGYRLKRVGSKVDDVTYYSFGLSGEILYKENPSKDKYEEYIYLFGQHYAKEVGKLSLPNEKIRMYYHTDHLGSTIAITDVNGDKIWSNNYTSFGKSTNESGLIEELGIYTGKEIDSETGLYYFNARWYDPEMGRFITEDPIKDGNNWYVYCNNNPLTYIDPTGLSGENAGGRPSDAPMGGYRGSYYQGEGNYTPDSEEVPSEYRKEQDWLASFATLPKVVQYFINPRQAYYLSQDLDNPMPIDMDGKEITNMHAYILHNEKGVVTNDNGAAILNTEKKYGDILIQNGWYIEDADTFHEVNGRPVIKLLNRNGAEQIYDLKTGEHITDPEFTGTSNKTPGPYKGDILATLGHAVNDVTTWVFFGANRNDTTSIASRISKLYNARDNSYGATYRNTLDGVYSE